MCERIIYLKGLSAGANETPRVDVTWNSTFSPVGNALGVTVIFLLTDSSTACISAHVVLSLFLILVELAARDCN